MMKLAVIALVVAMAYATPLTTGTLDEKWQIFKKVYGKDYGDEHIELARRLIWEQNLQYIQKHNMEADRGEHSFTLGVNQYADMTTEEFRDVMNGYVMSNRTRTGSLYLAPSHAPALPDQVDWRKEGYVTGVKNQGYCGSCWAFAATGSLEGQTFKKTEKLVSLSEQNLMDCSRKQGNKGCEGGLSDQGFRYIQENGGIDTEASYPYTAKVGVCRFKASDVGATDTGYTDILRGSESALKAAVATVGPIAIAMDAGQKSFQLYTHGIYSDPKCSSTRLDHGVLIVGYGILNRVDYWLVKNSYSAIWGMNGYFMVARNRNNMCGVATEASFPIV